MEIQSIKGKELNNCATRFYQVLAAFFLTIGTLPVSIGLIGIGPDESGMYLLNIINKTGLKFGSDLMFTYGPLGFLYNTRNIDSNALISFLFYGILTVAQIWLLWCTFRRLKGFSGNVLIGVAVVLFLCGASIWSKDYYICFLMLLAVSLAWVEPSPHRYLVCASVLTVAVSLMKFNTGVQCIITLVLFVGGKLLLEKRRALQYIWYIPAVMAAYAVSFLCYNPSLKAFTHYVSTNLNISSGYSSAMSLVPEPLHLVAAIVCGGCFCVFLVLVFTADFSSGVYLFLFSGALFQCFKHGYVRADAHVYIFFMGFLMMITIMALFLDYDRLLPALKQVRFRLICCGVLTIVMLSVSLYALNPSVRDLVNIFPNKVSALRYGISGCLDAKFAATEADLLPEDILDAIGQDTVAVLPWELSIGAYNDINMVTMPAMQSMMAYTPALDSENAAFFTGDAAPEYVIFSFYAIDDRVPLLETPATWQALYENYDAVLQEGTYLLLKKADSPCTTDLALATEQTFSSREQITLPKTENGTFVQVETGLTLWGKLNNFFYQIPPVTITMTWSDGTQTSGRVLPKVLENGVILDELPYSLTSMCQTMNGGDDGKKVVSFQFGGDGWKYYRNTMTVSFQTVLSKKQPYTYSTYENIQLAEAENPMVGKTAVHPESVWVDYLNEVPLKARTNVNAAAGLQISGWALDDANRCAAPAVYLEIHEKYYKLYQTNRADVCKAYYGDESNPMCGFEGWLPMETFASGEYPLSLIVLCDGGASYYRVDITTVSVTAD